jgi:hypothetical protein
MKAFYIASALLGAVSVVGSAQAAVIASENFTDPGYVTGSSWPADDLRGQNALGSGFTGKWIQDPTTYAGITITSPGALGRPHNNGFNAGIYANFSSPIALTSGQLYVSYEVSSAAALNGTRVDLIGNHNAASNAYIGTQFTLGGPFGIVTAASIGSASGLTNIATSGDHKIVGVLDYTNHKIALFVDPVAGSYYSASGANDAAVSATWTPVAPVIFNGLGFIENYSDVATFRNLVVASAATDVGLRAAPIPEPAVWATMLAGMGAIGGMVRRRRSSAPVAA